MDFDWRKIITVEPGKRGGKPCIRGLRIIVQYVLEYLAGGMSTKEILSDFPYLTRENIQACLAHVACSPEVEPLAMRVRGAEAPQGLEA